MTALLHSDSEVVRSSTRLAGLVKRYHAWPTLRQQTTGEHTWQVMRIYYEVFGPPEPDVAVYMLHHDAVEIRTGDGAFNAKRDHAFFKAAFDEAERLEAPKLFGSQQAADAALPAIGTIAKRRIKLCDLLEMWEFGREELKMGNQYAHPIINDTMAGIKNILSSWGSTPAGLETTDAVLAYINRSQV